MEIRGGAGGRATDGDGSSGPAVPDSGPVEGASFGKDGSPGKQRITGLGIKGYEDDASLDKSPRQAKEAIRQRITKRLNDETTADSDATTAELSGQFEDLSKAVTDTRNITYNGPPPTAPFDPLANGATGGLFDPQTEVGNGEFYADQAGWPPFDEHEYQSDHKEELNKLRKRLNVHMSKTPQQADAKRTGYYVLNEADKAYVEKDVPLGDALKKTAIMLVDIATDIIPITAAPKDFYRVVIGKDPLTGEALGKWERALAAGFLVAGIVTLGGSNVLSTEARALAKAARLAEEEVAAGAKVGEAAINAGNKWSRSAKTLQDQMALNAAQKGAVGDAEKLTIVLKDPRFKGMEKWE